jgi:hypothetical protein
VIELDPSAVTDQASFLEFVRALAADRRDEIEEGKSSPSSPWSAGANGWRNGTIEGFLEAALAWAEESGFGAKQGLGSSEPWGQFATFLYCGKIYE